MAKAKRRSKNPQTKPPPETKSSLETKPPPEIKPVQLPDGTIQLPDGTKLPSGTKLSPESGLPIGWGPIKPPPGWRLSSKIDPLHPEERFYEFDDDLSKPLLTQLWPETNLPELIAIQLRIYQRLTMMEAKEDREFKIEEVAAMFEAERLSTGALISSSKAKELATNIRPVKAMRGGNKPAKKRVKPSNP
jgi:hypothetical protein